MNKRITVALLAGVLLFATVAGAGQTMKPGLWEITSTMEMEGMPFQPPPQTVRHCYTEQEVRNEPVPRDELCKVIDLKTSGSKVTWKIECTGEAAGKGEGELIHRGDSAYEGRTRMQTQGTIMTMRYKGNRLGDCK
ncbi:MAG TPA: DUF3617 family protein [Desulfurivibrionaceae bacterium]|nr:MAG: DUF3617 domain-containing protein [Deltaproteobacteria bacterium]HSR35983.1 DUF3617 family protein [Desulfurivibrionaceae bacterium]